MRRIVVIPMDPIYASIKAGRSYQMLYEYFNPAKYFDEVYCLSPIGYGITPVGAIEKIENVYYIQADKDEFFDIIDKIHPDVVRAYGGRGCCDWAVASKVKNIPVVVSVHDTNPELISPSLIYADYIVCVSEAVKEAVRKKLGIEASKMKVMPNRVDVNIFQKKDNLEYALMLEAKYGKGKYILHVGRKVPQKNLDTVIKSLKYLSPEYKAIFLGHGDIKDYKDLAIDEGVAERCFFEPAIKKNELVEYFNWCTCMCTPSRWEGFGYVFIEAAACECTIVTSNIGPMNEYLCDGKSAYLVDEYENAEELAKIIQKACEETEKNKEMKREARKVGLKFSKEQIDEIDVVFYEKVISERLNNNYLADLIDKIDNRKIIIFGAGKNGVRLKNCCLKEQIAFWVDTNQEKIDLWIDGIKVISYEELKLIHFDYLIVVSPEKRNDIEEQLIKDGISYCNMEVYLMLKNRMV